MRPCFTILFLYSLLSLQAQPFHFQHFTPEDGLPSSTVYSFAQDKNGLIWIGTEVGLCSFDGKEYSSYTIQHGLPNNVVHKISIDYQNRIWINSLGRRFCYFENGKFYYTDFQGPGSDIAPYVICTDSTVWVFPPTLHSLNTTNPPPWIRIIENHRYPPSKKHPSLSYNAFQMEGKTVFTIGNLVGVNAAGKKEKTYHLPLQNFRNCVSYNENLLCLASEPAGTYAHLLLSLEEESGQLNYFLDSKKSDLGFKNLHDLLVDPAGNIWLGTNSGLFFLKDPHSKPIPALTETSINSLFLDREGNLWVATEGEGIYFLPYNHITFWARGEQLHNGPIRSLATDTSGNIFVGYTDGFFEHLNLDGQLQFSKKIDPERIVAITPKKEHAWILSNGQLHQYDYSGQIRFAEKHQFSFKSMVPFQESLFLLSFSLREFIPGFGDLDHRSNLTVRIYSAAVDTDTSILLGTTSGLYRFIYDSETYPYRYVQELDMDIRAIKPGLDDSFWIATFGFGVYQIRDGIVIDHITEQDGLPGNVCNDLVVDLPWIWIATNQGIGRININDRSVASFNHKDGLSSNEILYLAQTKNNVYAANNKGIDIIDKKSVEHSDPPALNINEILVNGTKVKIDTSFSLAYKQKNLEVDFIGLSYKNLGDITYSYQLEGINPQPIITTASFANWASVPPGNYTLRLKAKGKNTDWSPENRIHFTIEHAWWQTWWFILLCCLLGLIIIVLIVWSILRTQSRRNQLERQLQESELATLRAQMNPHFMFNSMNSIQEYINKNDNRSANLYLARFAKLIRGFLRSSRKRTLSLTEEIELLDLYLDLEKMRLGGSLNYTITQTPEVDSDWIQIPAMLIQPYVENAIIHGLFHKEGEKELAIHFSLAGNNALLCTIRDNGIGRAKAAEIKRARNGKHLSMSTQVTKTRMELINQARKDTFKVKYTDHTNPETKEALGTTVELLIPLND